MHRRSLLGGSLACLSLTAVLSAQSPQDPHAGMAPMQMADAPGWHFMQGGVAFVMFNDQILNNPANTRGTREVRAPNWWMGMASRRIHRGTLTINVMLSLDPATVGARGYGEIFQIGETFNGAALFDHQHPHDFLMQAAASWRQPLAKGLALTLSGAPVGDPALGPVAFMHRASAYENPLAPLGHHTLDSTHIAMGVVTAGVDRGPFELEGSVFRGAEPDEQRWDLMDPGRLDSWSARGWFRPSRQWELQVSHGYLTQPDALEEGNVRRTTASGSWRRAGEDGWTAVTLAWGRNRKLGGSYDAYLGELTHAIGKTTVYARMESTQVEVDVLRTGVHTFQGGRKKAHVLLPGRRDFVGAVTGGGTRTLWRPLSFDVAAGGELTGHGVPPSLTPFYGAHPWSFQMFLRVRPPSGHRMPDDDDQTPGMMRW
jgi:hypothetical protein